MRLANYRFDEAAAFVYQFFWGELCDWYLEIVKLRLNFDDAAQKSGTEAALRTLLAVFESALRLLSPFMPFITEEIWQALYDGKPPARSIALTGYPQASEQLRTMTQSPHMETLQQIIVAVRGLRKDLAIPEKEAAPIEVFSASHAGKLAEG